MVEELAGGIGDPQVRNWGTIGGSVAHADPASDWPAALIAFPATIVVRGKDGERAIEARDFFIDSFTTAIEPTEVLTEIRIPLRPRHQGAGYSKLERRVGDYATVGVAVSVRLEEDGTIQTGRHRRDRRLAETRSRRRTPSRWPSARPRARSSIAASATRPETRASRLPTSAVPSTTSARWCRR